MKIFMTSLFLIIASSAFAITPKEAWQNANMRDKVRLLNEYRDFYSQLDAQQSSELSEFKTTSYYQFFINDAYAASAKGMNCVYAGWPSKRVNNLCSSPQRQNPSYESGSCGASQMQCQPLLFGKDLCVPVSTKSQRSLAFSNCNKKFETSKKSTEDVVNQIKDEKKEADLFEYMDFAKEICATGKQASTPMCRRLEGALDRMKTAAERLKDSIEAPADEKVEVKKEDTKKDEIVPEIIVEGKKIETPTKEDLDLIETVKIVTNPPIPSLTTDGEVCEVPPVVETTTKGQAYLRDTPRFTQTEYVSSKTHENNFWDTTYVKYKEAPEEIYSGFDFRNSGPNSIADGEALLAGESVERSWAFVTRDGSKQESYLWVTDDAGSGKLSQLMESVILIVPRKVQPTVEIVGNDMVVTLPTGEKVIYDKMTKVIKSGVIKEGKVDLDPNRFNRKFAPVSYSGSGISIRVDKRGEDPRLLGGSATINQNGVTCKVPVTELWTSDANFKYGDDAKLLSFLNTKCGKKFKM